MFATTALFNLLTDAGEDWMKGFARVIRRRARVCASRQKSARVMGPGKLINCYGPTEGTVFATAHIVHDIPDSISSLPIGKPISNASVYILNEKTSSSHSERSVNCASAEWACQRVCKPS